MIVSSRIKTEKGKVRLIAFAQAMGVTPNMAATILINDLLEGRFEKHDEQAGNDDARDPDRKDACGE